MKKKLLIGLIIAIIITVIVGIMCVQKNTPSEEYLVSDPKESWKQELMNRIQGDSVLSDNTILLTYSLLVPDSITKKDTIKSFVIAKIELENADTFHVLNKSDIYIIQTKEKSTIFFPRQEDKTRDVAFFYKNGSVFYKIYPIEQSFVKKNECRIITAALVIIMLLVIVGFHRFKFSRANF